MPEPLPDPLQGAGGFGWMLLKTGLVLTVVCLLAYLVIRFWLRRFTVDGGSADSGARLQLVQRLRLEPRRSVQVIRAGSKVLLVGVTDGDIRLLCELDPKEWDEGDSRVDRASFKARFSEVLSASEEVDDPKGFGDERNVEEHAV